LDVADPLDEEVSTYDVGFFGKQQIFEWRLTHLVRCLMCPR